MPNQAKVKPSIRALNFALRTYLNPADIIPRLNGLKEYAYIRHDKDVTEAGNLVEPHYHVVLCFCNQHTINSICNTIEKVADISQADYNYYLVPTTVIAGGVAEAYDYLTHSRNSEKFQYSPNCVVQSSESYFQQRKSESNNVASREEANEQFLADLLIMEPLFMAKRYGRDYIKNFNAYRDFRSHIMLHSSIRHGLNATDPNEQSTIIRHILNDLFAN